MSQRAFQSSLNRLVLDPDFRDQVRLVGEDAFDDDLTDRERRRLLAVASDPGLDITRTLHKSFRLGKLLSTLPLTCAALGEEGLAAEVSRFWRARLPRSLYFLEEALAFCEYLTERRREGLGGAYLDTVIAYERATLELRLANLADQPPIAQGNHNGER